ncbi:MAG: hypothetical protein IPF73_07120 [Betaproteobacteria bacterium]|nr:hypothetical protein [Betaproteobacteria bacterium]
MQRDGWMFDYTALRLAEAAQHRMDWHRERLAFWAARREETLATIRSEGLEIDEKIVIGVHTPKARDWERANRVTVRDDLRMQLDEVLHKLKEHTERLVEYDGWRQMLAANPEARLSLDIADWLYFFGEPA